MGGQVPPVTGTTMGPAGITRLHVVGEPELADQQGEGVGEGVALGAQRELHCGQVGAGTRRFDHDPEALGRVAGRAGRDLAQWNALRREHADVRVERGEFGPCVVRPAVAAVGEAKSD